MPLSEWQTVAFGEGQHYDLQLIILADSEFLPTL